jgi:DNA topoisomerase IA
MGGLFSSSANKKPQRVSSHDKAVLDLKVQRDKLTQYQKKARRYPPPPPLIHSSLTRDMYDRLPPPRL